jgi:hypothetical protein
MTISPPPSTFAGPHTHNRTSRDDFRNLCNLICEFRNDIHAVSYHTWGTPGFPGTVNETLASVVTGLRGHGQQGQAQGNLQEGEVHRGDYLDPDTGQVSVIDCKADDRAFPGIDYRMRGQAFRLNGVQYIQIIWDEMDSNAVQQLQMPRIRAAFQGEAGSVQLLQLDENNGYCAIDNMGVTSAGGKWVEVEEHGIRRWEGSTRDAVAPNFGELVPWANSGLIPNNLVSNLVREHGLLNEEFQVSTGDLQSLATEHSELNVIDCGYHQITGSGNINEALEITTYTATPAAVRKIEQQGGSVSQLGLLQLLIDSGNDPRLPAGSYLRMARELNVENGEVFDFRIMQEDQHPHFEVTTSTFEHMLEAGIPFVTHFRDRLARYCVAVLIIRPNSRERQQIMNRICGEQAAKRARRQAQTDPGWGTLEEEERMSLMQRIQTELINNRNDWFPDQSLWVNLRLFPGCRRDCYYSPDNTWSLQNFGSHLLALAVEQPGGMEVIHWSPQISPTNDIRTESITRLLTGTNNQLDPMPIYPTPRVQIDYGDVESRQQAAQWFYQSCFLNFYRSMNNWADITNTARNIGFDDLGEHIALLWFGLRGSRVGTGSDAYNIDTILGVENAPTSEVKTCVGRRGDYMRTRHRSGVFHLGMNAEELQEHERIIFVRIIDRIRGDGGNLSVAILASNQDTIANLHSHIVTYCNRLPTSNEFEFMARPFADNYAQLSAQEQLHFVRLVEFVEFPADGNPLMNIQNQIPPVVECTCYVCALGGARWEPPRPVSRSSGEVRAWRRIRRIVDSNGNTIVPP